MYDSFADLYAIIVTTEKLETAFVRGTVTESEYEPACKTLLTQFRTLHTALRKEIPDVRGFMLAYKMDCNSAAIRLLDSGVPANLEHGGAVAQAADGLNFLVAQTVQLFITVMDSLKLRMYAVDQVHPLLTDLLASLNSHPHLQPEFVGKNKVKEWISTLNSMSASDELSEEKVRQLLFDLETSYSAFMVTLKSAR